MMPRNLQQTIRQQLERAVEATVDAMGSISAALY
jgi:hypothetical protein